VGRRELDSSDSGQGPAAVMNFCVPQKTGNFLTT
jgi:hypothetical protein